MPAERRPYPRSPAKEHDVSISTFGAYGRFARSDIGRDRGVLSFGWNVSFKNKNRRNKNQDENKNQIENKNIEPQIWNLKIEIYFGDQKYHPAISIYFFKIYNLFWVGL